MNRPQLLPPRFDTIPQELKDIPRWLLWRPEWKEDPKLPGGGKWNKPPVDAKTGGAGSSTNPETWADFDTARRAYEKEPQRWGGVGIVLSPDDPLMGGDCDRVIARGEGKPELTPEAARYVASLGTYWEVSPSGDGLRFFAFAEKPPGTCKRGNLEMYEAGRFLTVTGRQWPGTGPISAACQAAVEALHAEWFPPPAPRPKKETAAGRTPPVTGGVCAAPGDDNDLLSLATQAKNGPRVAALYGGDTSGHGGDHSAADLALCSMLAFYTGDDPARLDRLFRGSGLMRDKWDIVHFSNGDTYGMRTVRLAIDGCENFYEPGVRPEKFEASLRNGHGTRGFSDFSDFSDLPPALENDPWEEPIPFTNAALPPFPADALPGWLGDYVAAVAEAVEVPPDLPASLCLCVLAAAVQKKVEMEVKPGYREPLNLWTVTALESGARKSSTVDEVAAPLVDYEAEENRERGGKIAEVESDRAILEDRLKDAQRRAVKEKGWIERGAAQEEARALARELQNTPAPGLCRLMTEDCTPERLASLMAENGGRMTILSAEGGETFDIMAGRYSDKGPNLGIYLKGHAGDDVRVDRQGGKRSETIRRPALTLGLSPQPEVLRGLLKIPGALGRGLLARPLYSFPRSTVGYRTGDTEPVPESVRGDYHKKVRGLLGLKAAKTRCEGGDCPQPPPPFGPEGAGGEETPHLLRLSASARARLSEYRQKIEVELRDGGSLAEFKAWGSKLPGAVARIAGLLHLAALADKPEPWETPVSEATMRDAVDIGEYYREHSRAAFAEMGADKETDDARALLSFVRRHAEQPPTKEHAPDRFKSSEAYRSLHSRFKSSADMEPALRLLCARHYIRLVAQEKKATGRPSAPLFAINPALHKRERENPEPGTKVTKVTKPPATGHYEWEDADK